MKKISFPHVVCVGLLSILVFSCRKEEDSPDNSPANPLLELSFENSYLTLPVIDSAVFYMVGCNGYSSAPVAVARGQFVFAAA